MWKERKQWEKSECYSAKIHSESFFLKKTNKRIKIQERKNHPWKQSEILSLSISKREKSKVTFCQKSHRSKQNNINILKSNFKASLPDQALQLEGESKGAVPVLFCEDLGFLVGVSGPDIFACMLWTIISVEI